MAFKLCAGISAYNDKLIIRTLESLRTLERVFVIDGRYTNFPMTEEFSDIELRSKIAGYKNVTSYRFTGKEPEKRTQYLRLAEESGFNAIMVIDSDEFVVGDWGKFLQNAEKMYDHGRTRIACVPCRGYIFDHPELADQPRQAKTRWPRLFFKPAGLKYDPDFHATLMNQFSHAKFDLNEEHGYPLVEGITIIHSSAERGPLYKSRRDEYHTWLMEKEAEIRAMKQEASDPKGAMLEILKGIHESTFKDHTSTIEEA